MLKEIVRVINAMRLEEPNEDGLISLPVEMHPSRKAFEKLGFKFFKWRHENGSRVITDTVICLAKLPEGWQQCDSGISEQSYIVDKEGHTRVKVFERYELLEKEAEMTLIKNF